jgi:hypothetical protein
MLNASELVADNLRLPAVLLRAGESVLSLGVTQDLEDVVDKELLSYAFGQEGGRTHHISPYYGEMEAVPDLLNVPSSMVEQTFGCECVGFTELDLLGGPARGLSSRKEDLRRRGNAIARDYKKESRPGYLILNAKMGSNPCFLFGVGLKM